MELISREREKEILERLFNSNKPEFLAIYGRRRVGKTFLVRQFFKSKNAVFFYVTGAKDGSLIEQITHFTKQISDVFLSGLELKPAISWDETFARLTKAFEQVPKNKRIVLFFDELPWMATPKSRLLQSLDYYWNQFWSDNPRIKLIICGSAASWIIHKVIKNKGGLYNRITEKIYLEPFDLIETKQFLHAKGVKLNNQQVFFIYSVVGGVPYYLSKIQKGKSAAQIIEYFAFSKKSFLLDEFDDLFSSLFNDGDVHAKIVKILAKNRYGVAKRKLLESVGKSAVGSGGMKKLRELEETGFIMSFKPLYHKTKGIYYRLTDEYTLFYLKWIAPIRETLYEQAMETGYWQAMQNTPEWYGWLGYAFEAVCYKHVAEIRKGLSIGPRALVSTWRYAPRRHEESKGAQIDLLFDRNDHAITLCEIKYSEKPFVLNKNYADNLQQKMKIFKEQTRTKKQLVIAIIAANGLQNNYYAEDLISGVVTLDDLFKGDAD